MDDDQYELLKKTAKLSKANYKMLKSMKRQQTIGSIVSLIKWIVIIAITIWSYYLIEPWIEQTKNMIEQVQETTQNVKEFQENTSNSFGNFDPTGLQNLLDKFKISDQ